LSGKYDGATEAAVLVDSVTGTAFGPMFDDEQEADDFLTWFFKADPGTDSDRCLTHSNVMHIPVNLPNDPRNWHDGPLAELISDFRAIRKGEQPRWGKITDEQAALIVKVVEA
jgi:hypothetical protein